jgi:hypothetical protein
MAKNDWILPVVLLAGGYIWYTKFNGKSTVDGILAELKGGLGGGSGSQINTGDNISGGGDVPTVEGISGQVQSMLQKMGVHGSGESISRTRQVDTTGKAKQTQTHSQKSTVFYTIPRFGNL